MAAKRHRSSYAGPSGSVKTRVLVRIILGLGETLTGRHGNGVETQPPSLELLPDLPGRGVDDADLAILARAVEGAAAGGARGEPEDAAEGWGRGGAQQRGQRSHGTMAPQLRGNT